MRPPPESRHTEGVRGGAVVTGRQEPGTNGGASVTSGRDDGLFLLGAAGALSMFAVVNTFSVQHEFSETGRRLPFWEPFVWETSSIVVILALMPLFMAFARRVWPLDPPWPRVAALHFLGLLAFSFLHIAGMGILRGAVYAALGDFYAPFAPLGDFLYEFRKDALGYVGFVFLYVVWRLVREPPSQSPTPADSVEVRDGARRHFVPLAEVAWIEAAGNYVELHRGETPILHRASLSAMERELQGAGFVRVHRSRLVRRGAVAQVESKPSGDFIVRLNDGRELAGSRRYRRPLLEP